MMVECDKTWYGTSAACALWNEDVNLTIVDSKYECLKNQDGDYVKYIGLEVTRNRELNRFEVTMARSWLRSMV